MRNIRLMIGALAVLALGLASGAEAVKYRTYTLPELVEKADAIVLARITVREGGVQAHVVRSLKGDPAKDIIVDSFAALDRDKARFENQETAILFLQKEEGGRRLLLGYGDQGKWPRRTGEWPFADVHVVPVEKVEAAVHELRALEELKEPAERVVQVKTLLSSEDPFVQAYVLEYLMASEDQKLNEVVAAEVLALRRETKDKYLKALGDSIDRAYKTPNEH